MAIKSIRNYLICAGMLLFSCLALNAQSATVRIKYIEHDVVLNNQKGMKIHCSAELVGYKGGKVNLAVFFYKGYNGSDGKLMASDRGQYRATDGHVGVFDYSVSNYDDCVWNDWWMFIPHSAFPHVNGTNEYSCYVELRKTGEGNWQQFAASDYTNFQITFGGATNTRQAPVKTVPVYNNSYNDPNVQIHNNNVAMYNQIYRGYEQEAISHWNSLRVCNNNSYATILSSYRTAQARMQSTRMEAAGKGVSIPMSPWETNSAPMREF